MLDLAAASFDYEPYPTGLIEPVFDAGLYARLVSAYPARELFDWKPALGHRYTLSETHHRAQYRRFIEGTRDWKRFHDHVKAADFVPRLLTFLAEHNLDLGWPRDGRAAHRSMAARAGLFSRLRARTKLGADFEFSMTSADGGHVLPQTDACDRLVTLVFSMVAEGEWNPAWGGSTDVVAPRNRALVFNQVNRSLPFGDVDVLRRCEFRPNQCLIFIKTYNSWHAVAPMRGEEGKPAWRKTLTVSIDARR